MTYLELLQRALAEEIEATPAVSGLYGPGTAGGSGGTAEDQQGRDRPCGADFLPDLPADRPGRGLCRNGAGGGLMAVAYYGSHISEHLVKTPEGYLICYDVPINRTGTQMYTAGELGLEGEPERPVTVYRLEEDVFSPAALASLEGKDITRGHPAEMLAAENQASYSKGTWSMCAGMGTTPWPT